MTHPTPDPLRERLHRLETLAAPLHPDAEAREELAEAAFVHAEALLDELERAPAWRSDDGSRAIAETPIGPDPIDPETVFSLLVRHVDALGQTTHAPGFMGYIPGGNLYHAAIADFLAAVSNRYSGVHLAAPGAVRVENHVLRWLASVVGYPAGAAGILTSGGSLANLSAIVAAREAAGLRSEKVPRGVVYLTEQTHHCVPKALRIAGLEECVVRRVPMDGEYRMRPDALDEAIAADLGSGKIPWLVVATAGSTDVGAVDPLEAIADVAARRRIWLHVDGAYGAMFALTAEGKRRLRGIERSDSVVLDPHKGLYLPFGIGALLVRDGRTLRRAHRFEASYVPENAYRDEEPSPSELSPELSRPFRALRVWLPLLLLGTRPFEASLEEKLLLARYAHGKLAELPGIEVGPEPDLSVVVFRVRHEGGEEEGATERLLASIQADGKIYVSGTKMGGRLWIRLAILASRTHRDCVDRALDLVREGVAAAAPALEA